MPGSEYYEPTQEEIDFENRRKEARTAYWTKTLDSLQSIRSSDSKFEKKLEDLKDYAKARIWDNRRN